MSIYKRNDIYWIDVTSPSGQRIRQTTGTTVKQLAQEFHDKFKADLWNWEKLNKIPQRLFDEALLMFLQESQQQKDFETKKRHAIYWRKIFGGRTLNSISGEDILKALPTHSVKTKQALSKSTQNRYRTSIMRVMSIAYKNGWLDRVPYVKKFEEPKVRVRWISQVEAQTLLSNLRLPWMKNVCTFALLTGARMNEILSLTWDKVDFERQIAIVSNDVAKSGRARALPLNSEAMDLLINLKANKRHQYVFHRNTDKRIGRIDWVDFHRAMELSDIKNFRFHDLRHTWASWHAQAGTPLYTLKELGGWETLEMVKKYAHLNADHMLKYASHVTITAQSPINLMEEKYLVAVNS